MVECKNSIGILYGRESVTHVSMHILLERKERFGVKRPKNYDAHHRSGQSLGPPGWNGWMGTRYLYYPVSVQLCIQYTQVGT